MEASTYIRKIVKHPMQPKYNTFFFLSILHLLKRKGGRRGKEKRKKKSNANSLSNIDLRMVISPNGP